jgi:hypothetical protein
MGRTLAVVVAHPDAMPDDVCTGCKWTHDDFDPALADAIEIWGGLWDGPEEENEGCVALWQRWLSAGHRLAATAATDAHRPKDWEGAVPLTSVVRFDNRVAHFHQYIRDAYVVETAGSAWRLAEQYPNLNSLLAAAK